MQTDSGPLTKILAVILVTLQLNVLFKLADSTVFSNLDRLNSCFLEV